MTFIAATKLQKNNTNEYLQVRLKLIDKKGECSNTITQFPIPATGKSRGA